MHNPFLIGERLYLRPARDEDIDSICRGENDPRVRETLFLALPSETENTRKKIADWQKSEKAIVFSILQKSDDCFIGQTAFFRIDYISRAAVFYLAILDPDHWSKGYGSESTEMMVQYAFDTLNLNRIQLHVFADNQAAIRIYQKEGFLKEGILRQAMYHHGEYCDFWVMGLLQEDWRKKKRDQK